MRATPRRAVPVGVLLVLLAGLAIEGPALAALQEEATLRNEEHDKRIDYIELASTDLAESKRFYGAVFGWTFQDWGDTYVSFQDGRLDGGFRLEEEVTTAGPLVILFAVDLEAVEASVREHGGEIVKEIFSFPGGRRFHFKDPSDNELAVWSDR